MLSSLRHTIKIIPILFVFGILYACENDMQEVASLTKTKMPTRKGVDVQLVYSENAHVQVEITTPLMEEFVGEENYTEMKKGIKAIFYDSLMNVSSVLTSKYAIQYPDERKMEVKNKVVVTNHKGEKLNTEHLIWLQDSAKIYSEEFVTITTENEILMGTGFEAKQDFSSWKIHNITGVINVAEEKDSLK